MSDDMFDLDVQVNDVEETNDEGSNISVTTCVHTQWPCPISI